MSELEIKNRKRAAKLKQTLTGGSLVWLQGTFFFHSVPSLLSVLQLSHSTLALFSSARLWRRLFLLHFPHYCTHRFPFLHLSSLSWRGAFALAYRERYGTPTLAGAARQFRVEKEAKEGDEIQLEKSGEKDTVVEGEKGWLVRHISQRPRMVSKKKKEEKEKEKEREKEEEEKKKKNKEEEEAASAAADAGSSSSSSTAASSAAPSVSAASSAAASASSSPSPSSAPVASLDEPSSSPSLLSSPSKQLNYVEEELVEEYDSLPFFLDARHEAFFKMASEFPLDAGFTFEPADPVALPALSVPGADEVSPYCSSSPPWTLYSTPAFSLWLDWHYTDDYSFSLFDDLPFFATQPIPCGDRVSAWSSARPAAFKKYPRIRDPPEKEEEEEKEEGKEEGGAGAEEKKKEEQAVEWRSSLSEAANVWALCLSAFQIFTDMDRNSSGGPGSLLRFTPRPSPYLYSKLRSRLEGRVFLPASFFLSSKRRVPEEVVFLPYGNSLKAVSSNRDVAYTQVRVEKLTKEWRDLMEETEDAGGAGARKRSGSKRGSAPSSPATSAALSVPSSSSSSSSSSAANISPASGRKLRRRLTRKQRHKLRVRAEINAKKEEKKRKEAEEDRKFVVVPREKDSEEEDEEEEGEGEGQEEEEEDGEEEEDEEDEEQLTSEEEKDLVSDYLRSEKYRFSSSSADDDGPDAEVGLIIMNRVVLSRLEKQKSHVSKKGLVSVLMRTDEVGKEVARVSVVTTGKKGRQVVREEWDVIRQEA